MIEYCYTCEECGAEIVAYRESPTRGHHQHPGASMIPFDEAMLIAKHIADVGESPTELVKQLHRAGLLKGPTPLEITLDREQAYKDYKAHKEHQ